MSKNSKRKPIHGLDKIPEKAWLKILEKRVQELEIERGKDQSYIQELEHELEQLNKLGKEDLKDLLRIEAYNKLNKKVEKLNYKVYTLNRDIKRIIEKNVKLKMQLDEIQKGRF